ncbi:MAG: hypothetical protein OEO20_01480 [Gemmatimonadota bacterium]|nr:hypothetical protein [Gemmatimonadota bacterium]MDH3366201.1 hypothetical protein [Gemmatimonadota bacterium]MDH3476958.1 hypothetical protein [Gemmatimonadota bacterium]MDH5549188.1 hypothetical protein [Gemmatimonadota bacterium]
MRSLTPWHQRLAGAAALLATALVVGCSASGSTARTAAAPELPSTFTYGPFTAVYEIASHSHTEQDFGGQVQTVDFSLTYYITATAVQTGGAAQLTITLDSAPKMSDLPPAAGISKEEIQRAAGTTYRGILAPDGEILAFQGSTAGGQFAEQLNTAMERFFPRIPIAGLAPGQTWSDSASTTTQSGGLDLGVETTTSFEARDWLTRNGTQALEVAAVADYTVSGGGSQSGMDIGIDGSGVRRSLLYLAQDGRYLGGATADTSNLVATVAAMGAMIPVTQIRHDTVRVVR